MPRVEARSPKVGESLIVLNEYPILALIKSNDGFFRKDVWIVAYIGIKLFPP